MENPQRFGGHKTEKTHEVFYVAVRHGAPYFGMPADFIADHDKPEVLAAGRFLQGGARDRERLNQAGYVLAGIDAPGVEEKWLLNLITVEDALPLLFGAHGLLREYLIRGVVDQANAAGGFGEKLIDRLAC